MHSLGDCTIIEEVDGEVDCVVILTHPNELRSMKIIKRSMLFCVHETYNLCVRVCETHGGAWCNNRMWGNRVQATCTSFQTTHVTESTLTESSGPLTIGNTWPYCGLKSKIRLTWLAPNIRSSNVTLLCNTTRWR